MEFTCTRRSELKRAASRTSLLNASKCTVRLPISGPSSTWAWHFDSPSKTVAFLVLTHMYSHKADACYHVIGWYLHKATQRLPNTL